MGRIPELRRRRNIETFREPGRINDAQRMGARIDNALSAGVQIFQEKRRAQDQSWLAESSATLQANAQEIESSHRKTRANNPNESWSDLKKSLQSNQENILKNAPSDRAKEMFRQKSFMLEENLRARNTSWESQQLTSNIQVNAANHFESIQTQAYRSGDPSQIDALFGQANEDLAALDRYSKPEVAAKARIGFKRNVAMETFEGMIDQGRLKKNPNLLT